MATVPTVADFRLRFPEFARVSSARIQLFLDDAARIVGTDWIEGDYTLGVLYHAAFNLERGNAAARATKGNLPGPVRSQSMDGMSQTYELGFGSGGSVSLYNANSYGVRFLELARANTPRVLLV